MIPRLVADVGDQPLAPRRTSTVPERALTALRRSATWPVHSPRSEVTGWPMRQDAVVTPEGGIAATVLTQE